MGMDLNSSPDPVYKDLPLSTGLAGSRFFIFLIANIAIVA